MELCTDIQVYVYVDGRIVCVYIVGVGRNRTKAERQKEEGTQPWQGRSLGVERGWTGVLVFDRTEKESVCLQQRFQLL